MSLVAGVIVTALTLSDLKINFAVESENKLETMSHIIENICKTIRLRVILIGVLKDASTLSKII